MAMLSSDQDYLQSMLDITVNVVKCYQIQFGRKTSKSYKFGPEQSTRIPTRQQSAQEDHKIQIPRDHLQLK